MLRRILRRNLLPAVLAFVFMPFVMYVPQDDWSDTATTVTVVGAILVTAVLLVIGSAFQNSRDLDRSSRTL